MAPKLPHGNSYWVVPGRVIAGEYPGDADSTKASRKVRQHLEAGVRFFVDLTEEGELIPYDDILASEASRLGISKFEYRRFEIPDVSIPHSDELTASVLDAIDRGSRELPTVYIHCRGGVGRTGTIVGCYFKRHLGFSGDEALDTIAGLWECVDKSVKIPASPETPEQCDYVRTWREPSR